MAQAVGSWRDVAAAVAQHQPVVAVPPVDTFGLSADLAADVRRLETLPPPRKLERCEHWRPIVADALSLARDGWAAKAVALGWSAHDLFGVGPVDDWEFSGLAVWIAGREVLALDAAVAVAGPRDRCATFIRGGMGHGTHPSVAPVLLWEFGR